MSWLAWLKANWLTALAVGTGVALLPRAVSAKSTTSTTSPTDKKPPPHLTGFARMRRIVDEVGKAAGLSSGERQWLVRFAVLQASSESGADNYRGLGDPSKFPAWAKPSGAVKKGGKWLVSPKASARMRKLQTGEANAARVAWERQVTRGTLPAGDYKESDYTFGSGGWFAFLPGNGAYAFHKSNVPGEFGPLDVFNGPRSVLMLMRTIAALTRYSDFRSLPDDDKVTGLKRSLASVTLMGKPDAERSKLSASKARAAAKKHGIPSSFFDEPIPPGLSKSRDWVAIARKVEGRGD